MPDIRSAGEQEQTGPPTLHRAYGGWLARTDEPMLVMLREALELRSERLRPGVDTRPDRGADACGVDSVVVGVRSDSSCPSAP